MNAAARRIDLLGDQIANEPVSTAEMVERARRAIGATSPAPPIGSDRWKRAFRVTGPGTISFSGGRTSAYMLWSILEAYDGKLPPDVHCLFSNTGREMPATLAFVADCANAWGVKVHWLEYRRDAETGRVWTEEVSHNSCSRNGEPFRAMLEAKSMLPNPTMRFCTAELKVRTMKRFSIETLGFTRWTDFIGLRACEPKRLVKIALRNADRKERFRASSPLAAARQTKAHVMQFWQRQPFDLDLKGAWEGNCDFCFLKSLPAIARMALDHPELAQAWAEDEQNASYKGTINPSMALYRKDRPSYSEIIRGVARNPFLPGSFTEADLDPDTECEGATCGF